MDAVPNALSSQTSTSGVDLKKSNLPWSFIIIGLFVPVVSPIVLLIIDKNPLIVYGFVFIASSSLLVSPWGSVGYFIFFLFCIFHLLPIVLGFSFMRKQKKQGGFTDSQLWWLKCLLLFLICFTIFYFALVIMLAAILSNALRL